MKNQERVTDWVRSTFTMKEANDVPERALRMAEEAIELAQACDVDVATAHRLVDYVFSRPKGRPAQELAGCMVALYAVAAATGDDADAELEKELERIRHPEVVERCRRRQHEKRAALGVAKTTAERPSWPETWMAITRTIAERSYDPRLKVGAIIVSADNTQMLAGGYNGNYAGGPHEHESSEPGQSGFIHAEVNALVKHDFNFPKEKHMYVTHSPCRMCSKLIINAGIEQVVFGEAYRDPSGIDLLRSAGVLVRSLEQAVQIGKRPKQ